MVGRGLLLAGLALPGEGKMVHLLKSLHLHAFSIIRLQRIMFFQWFGFDQSCARATDALSEQLDGARWG